MPATTMRRPRRAAARRPVNDWLADLEVALGEYRSARDEIERGAAIGHLLRATWAASGRLRSERQYAVEFMRSTGMTYGQIGEVLGVTKSRAKQIEVGASGGDYYRAEIRAGVQTG